MYTSKELSKKLADNGCKLESEKYYNGKNGLKLEQDISAIGWMNGCYPAYDILNDICVKYKYEFFGEEPTYLHLHTTKILNLLMYDKIKEAEDYIWLNCKFNKKNK